MSGDASGFSTFLKGLNERIRSPCVFKNPYRVARYVPAMTISTATIQRGRSKPGTASTPAPTMTMYGDSWWLKVITAKVTKIAIRAGIRCRLLRSGVTRGLVLT